ncbi:MAG: hypothetical protein IPH13_03740 [Planctomycetes bacterium]|nr:hypothetical protein [Planctomycetota bacterium]MCC7172721.1 hypothetical protein [Planctomycetota bacterium]
MVRRHLASLVAAIALCGAAMLWVTIGDDTIEATPIAASPSDVVDDGSTPPTSEPESTDPSPQQRALVAGGVVDSSVPQEWTPEPIDANSIALTVRAVDPSGRPISDAALSCCAFGYRFGRLVIDSIQGLETARTDARGIAKWSAKREDLATAGVTSVDADRLMLTFVIGAPGFRTVELFHVATFGAAADRGEVTLAPGIALEGRVVDADGAPASGVVVIAQRTFGSTGSTSTRSPHGWPRPYARTDRDGHFVLEGLQRAEIAIAAFRTNRAIDSTCPWGRSGPIDLRRDLEPDPVIIRLDRGAPQELTLRGVVRDRDGRPIPGVLLRVDGTDVTAPASGLRAAVSMAGGFPISMVSDEHGAFACACAPSFADRVRGASLSLHVRDPSWRFAERRVEPVALGQTELSIELQPVRILEVACSDTSRAPLHGCDGIVSLSTDVGSSQLHRVDARADDASLRIPTPMSPFYVRIGKRGFRFEWLGPFEPATAPERVDVTLQRLAGFRGVVTANGLPVDGVRVTLSVGDANPPTSAVPARVLREVEVGQHDAMDSTRTDAFGAFELFSWEADGYDHPTSARERGSWTKPPMLTVQSPTRGVARLLLPISAWREPVDVGTIALSPGATLRGRVIGPHRQRPVLLDRGDTTVVVVPVAADGTFAVDGLGPGSYAVGCAKSNTDDVIGLARDANRVWRRIDRRLLSTPASIEIPDAGETSVELITACDPTPLRVAIDWGGFAIETASGKLVPLDDPHGVESTTPPGWNASLAWLVQVDRPGRFAITLRLRSAGTDVIVTDTITLMPGVPASWELSVALAEMTLPISTTPHRSGSWEALTQSVRAGCSITTTVVRQVDGHRPVHGVVGVAGRVIRLPAGTSPWLTPAVLESAETLLLVPAPLPAH